jgi:hypothetical protein
MGGTKLGFVFEEPPKRLVVANMDDLRKYSQRHPLED